MNRLIMEAWGYGVLTAQAILAPFQRDRWQTLCRWRELPPRERVALAVYQEWLDKLNTRESKK